MQKIFKSIHVYSGYRVNKKAWGTDRQTDGQTTAISISLTAIAGDNKDKTIAKCEINSQWYDLDF